MPGHFKFVDVFGQAAGLARALRECGGGDGDVLVSGSRAGACVDIALDWLRDAARRGRGLGAWRATFCTFLGRVRGPLARPGGSQDGGSECDRERAGPAARSERRAWMGCSPVPFGRSSRRFNHPEQCGVCVQVKDLAAVAWAYSTVEEVVWATSLEVEPSLA